MPKLGPSFAALTCNIVVIIVFLLVWIFINDAKVGRALLVWTFGDGYEITKSLLSADTSLPYYRIFAYDAYRLAFFFSLGAVPFSLAGIWLARRAIRLIRSDSAGFGGNRIAWTSYGLSICLFIVFSAVTISSTPREIAKLRAQRVSATRAMMYRLHAEALQKYHKEYGKYPGELADLSLVNAEETPQSDYWERGFEYNPISVVASKGFGASWTNYTLTSAGPDGKLGTKDDIIMVDGVIVDSENETDSAQKRAR
ncbi:MAG TPA: hypothetical protein VJ810_30280 [Blastocatellia bacterium]|nr:hypothetical protein [Blastocatellia bacterium]